MNGAIAGCADALWFRGAHRTMPQCSSLGFHLAAVMVKLGALTLVEKKPRLKRKVRFFTHHGVATQNGLSLFTLSPSTRSRVYMAPNLPPADRLSVLEILRTV